jgi:hypothetical protein
MWAFPAQHLGDEATIRTPVPPLDRLHHLCVARFLWQHFFSHSPPTVIATSGIAVMSERQSKRIALIARRTLVKLKWPDIPAELSVSHSMLQERGGPSKPLLADKKSPGARGRNPTNLALAALRENHEQARLSRKAMGERDAQFLIAMSASAAVLYPSLVTTMGTFPSGSPLGTTTLIW